MARILLFLFILPGCSPREKMEKHADTAVMSKHNWRWEKNDGYKVEVWTLGNGVPIGVGIRAYVEKGEKDNVPRTTLSLSLTKCDEPKKVLEVVLNPALKKTAIDGGYLESLRTEDGKEIEQRGRFIGEPGVWEVLLDNPLSTDPRKSENALVSGKYLLNVEIAIEKGPMFTFQNIPHSIPHHSPHGD